MSSDLTPSTAELAMIFKAATVGYRWKPYTVECDEMLAKLSRLVRTDRIREVMDTLLEYRGVRELEDSWQTPTG